MAKDPKKVAAGKARAAQFTSESQRAAAKAAYQAKIAQLYELNHHDVNETAKALTGFLRMYLGYKKVRGITAEYVRRRLGLPDETGEEQF